jgi:DNA-binding MarR family transcriptional regulator
MQHEILTFLRDNPTSWFSSREIADRMKVSREIVTKDCGKLFTKWGLIDRKANPKPNRSNISFVWKYREC